MQVIARFRNANDAVEFESNTARTVALVADTAVARAGRDVTFHAKTRDEHGDPLLGDVELSASYYGATRIAFGDRPFRACMKTY